VGIHFENISRMVGTGKERKPIREHLIQDGFSKEKGYPASVTKGGEISS